MRESLFFRVCGWLAAGLIVLGAPSAFAQNPPAWSSIVLEFTTTLHLQDTAGSKVHTVSKSQYGVMMNEDPLELLTKPRKQMMRLLARIGNFDLDVDFLFKAASPSNHEHE